MVGGIRMTVGQLLNAVVVEAEGGRIKMYCPFCDDPHPNHLHLHVDMDTGVFFCFRCERGGSLSTTLRLMFCKKAFGPLDGGGRRPIAAYANALRELPAARIPGYTPIIDYGDDQNVQAHMVTEYLESRGLDLGTLYEYDVGVSSEFPFYAIFPFYEWHPEGRRLVFFIGRKVVEETEKSTKYVFPRKSDGWPGKSEVVYGLDRIRPGSVVAVTEGVLDSIACPFGVSIQGSSLSVVQAKKITAMNPSKVVMMGDGDNAGTAGSARSHTTLREVGYSGLVLHGVVPPGEDPCSLGRAGCTQVMRGAVRCQD